MPSTDWQVDALMAELQTWNESEQKEVLAVLEDESDEHRGVLFGAVVDAIRKRRAANAPVPQDQLAVALREMVSERDMVRVTRNLLAEALADPQAAESVRSSIRKMLEDMRSRGFPMDDA